MYMEVLVYGNFYKEDVLKLIDMIEKMFKLWLFFLFQWCLFCGLVFFLGLNYVWKKMFKDFVNVNYLIYYMFYIGVKIDCFQRVRIVFLDQIMYEFCFDQFCIKEQFGYIVYCGFWSNVIMFGVYFII